MVSKSRGDAKGKVDVLLGPYRDQEGPGRLEELLKAAFEDTPVIESVAHFSEGTLDSLVRWRVPEPGLDGELLAEEESRPGRQLIERMAEFDRALSALKTGYLMRFVVSTPEGGCHVGRVKDGLHTVGVTLDGEAAVETLDDRMNLLVAQIRSKLYELPSELLGGNPCVALEDLEPEPRLRFDLAEGQEDREGEEGQESFDRLRGLWLKHLNTRDLHYAAYYRDWEQVCWGDVLDALPAARFSNITAGARRGLYRNLAQDLRYDLVRVRRVLKSLTRSEITRMVLDVEEGAIYVHWLGGDAGDFLMAATLNQTMVNCAELRLRSLAGMLRDPGSG